MGHRDEASLIRNNTHFVAVNLTKQIFILITGVGRFPFAHFDIVPLERHQVNFDEGVHCYIGRILTAMHVIGASQ